MLKPATLAQSDGDDPVVPIVQIFVIARAWPKLGGFSFAVGLVENDDTVAMRIDRRGESLEIIAFSHLHIVIEQEVAPVFLVETCTVFAD